MGKLVGVMRILQLDVDKIEYTPIEPEIKTYDDAEKKTVSIENALVLLVSIERGDDESIASKAISDAADFSKKLKRNKIVIYPFAHLSSELEGLGRARELIHVMKGSADTLFEEAYAAPFGWNKKLSLDIKGHPLAEMSRSYSNKEKEG